MSRPKKQLNRLEKLLAEMKILKFDKLGWRGRTKMYVCEYPKFGCNVVIFHKKEDAFFRDGLPLNEAVEQGRLAWMIDDSMIPILEHTFNVKYAIFYRDRVEDIHISRMSDWTDEDKRYVIQNPNAMKTDHNRGSFRHLSTAHMLESPGKPSLSVR